MDKLELINKEKKDCKLNLNELYEIKKTSTDEEAIKELDYQINALAETRKILLNLHSSFINGTGEKELEEITKENNEQYQMIQKILKEDKETYWKVIYLKDSLDNINEIYLSKKQISEYLEDFYEIMNIARKNIHIPIWQSFLMYMQSTNQQEKANYMYYINMIKIHILFVNMRIISLIKDEDFEHIKATDIEMGEKTKTGSLAFLNNKFIVSTDATKFRKHNIINFIRNAFCHSDNNELYKITSNCNSVIINLKNTKPIPFKIKLNANDISLVAISLSEYSHHITTYEIKNQENINIENLIKDYQTCSCELDRINLTRIMVKDNVTSQKNKIMDDINQNKAYLSQKNLKKTITQYGTLEEKIYNFSEHQKKLYYEKLKYFYPLINNIGFKYFIAPIILNYMQGGIYKLNNLFYDSLISHIYLFNPENSLYKIMEDIIIDFDKLMQNKKIESDKKSLFNLIGDNIDQNKAILLYLFDDNERQTINEYIYLTYIYGTVNNEEEITIGNTIYKSEQIRNAFTHGRFMTYEKNNTKYISLYDDEDLIANPTQAYWKVEINYNDLINTAKSIMKDYINKTK